MRIKHWVERTCYHRRVLFYFHESSSNSAVNNRSLLPLCHSLNGPFQVPWTIHRKATRLSSIICSRLGLMCLPRYQAQSFSAVLSFDSSPLWAWGGAVTKGTPPLMTYSSPKESVSDLMSNRFVSINQPFVRTAFIRVFFSMPNTVTLFLVLSLNKYHKDIVCSEIQGIDTSCCCKECCVVTAWLLTFFNPFAPKRDQFQISLTSHHSYISSSSMKNLAFLSGSKMIILTNSHYPHLYISLEEYFRTCGWKKKVL